MADQREARGSVFSCGLLGSDCAQQFPFGALHGESRFGIGLTGSHEFQLFQGYAGA